jgi:hypothetical protein
MVNDLIGRDANVNATDASGVTPLHIIASKAGSPKATAIAQALVDAGADKNAQDNQGRSPTVQLTGANTQEVALIIQNAPTKEAVEAPEEEERILTEEEIMQLPAGRLQIYVTPQRQQYQPGRYYVPTPQMISQ